MHFPPTPPAPPRSEPVGKETPHQARLSIANLIRKVIHDMPTTATWADALARVDAIIDTLQAVPDPDKT